MEVNQLQAILHAALLEVIESFECFSQGQPEFGAETGTVAPAAGTAGPQL